MHRRLIALIGSLGLAAVLGAGAAIGGAQLSTATVQSIAQVTTGDTAGVVIFQKGPFTFRGRCSSSIGYALVSVTTTQAHSVYFANETIAHFDMQPGVSHAALYETDTVSGGDKDFTTTTFTALSPSGTKLTGQLYIGYNVLGRTGKCVFGGYLVAP